MANSDFILILLVFMVCVDLLSFLGQAAITDINPQGLLYSGVNPVNGTKFYTCEGGMLSSATSDGNCSKYTVEQEPRENLPDATSPLEPTTENIFTDLFSSIKSFFVEKALFGDVFRILAGPMVYLGALGLPQSFVFALSAAWMAIGFFLLISYFWGR